MAGRCVAAGFGSMSASVQDTRMKRRAFILALGGAAASVPLAARAQQATGKVARIGVLMDSDERLPESQSRIQAFREGLQQLGWTEGRNARIEVRWAAGIDRIRNYTAEMIALTPDVIVANGTPFVDALHKATGSIPIVFVLSNDPVGLGHIASMAKPGGNITGFTFMELSLIGKWLDMLKQIAPAATRSALIFDPDTTPYYIPYLRGTDTAPPLPLHLEGAQFHKAEEFEAWIEFFARQHGSSLILPAGPFGIVNGRSIARLAEQFKLPAISIYRQFALDGGLMAYGPDPAGIFRQSADYVDRILRGERVGDLPAQAPTQFHLVINLKTAKTLGLSPPTTLLATADEVIE
jgi:putative ABC transport system substrate-binding protein